MLSVTRYQIFLKREISKELEMISTKIILHAESDLCGGGRKVYVAYPPSYYNIPMMDYRRFQHPPNTIIAGLFFFCPFQWHSLK